MLPAFIANTPHLLKPQQFSTVSAKSVPIDCDINRTQDSAVKCLKENLMVTQVKSCEAVIATILKNPGASLEAEVYAVKHHFLRIKPLF